LALKRAIKMQKLLIRKCARKRLLDTRHKHRWDGDVKMIRKDKMCAVVDWVKQL